MVHFPKLNIKKIILYLVLVCAFGFLIVHTFNLANITVDTTSIILLLLILGIPFVDLVRKIKYGDFEAEINPKEVEQTINKVNVEYSPTLAPTDEYGEEILDLVQSDPQLGLAKLRIELEKSLTLLLTQRKNPTKITRYSPLFRILTDLEKFEVIPPELASALKDILPLINRAVHGQYIRQEDANKVAITGVRMLNNLNEIYQNLAFQPLEQTIISFDDIEMYEQSKYRVTTVIPYVENPVKNVYIWDRETLMDFLFDSSQYAEFPISIEKVDDEQKRNF